MNIPNMLTILRIILVPVYLVIFFSNMDNRILIAGLVFILAGISDVLDGHIARKYNLQTKIGTVLDPFADKMMTFAILISFTLSNFIPGWILIALGIKEILLILGGAVLYFSKANQVIPSNKFGKYATALFYAATLSIVFKLPSTISEVLFLVTVVLNILALVNYLGTYLDIVKNRKVSVDKK
ncbi:MAG: CDP-diacylglycerol--glycerol-3-phosphate 3-phosphatidyltransferase [Tissierellaceae bacterium]|nr:CDP-diacylglycerol--glycerol-3-phosphate 3-phosphatidyltransferase [Tissierellaceae bacterium]